jgi:hypothetical protein
VDTLGGEVAADADTDALGGDGHGVDLFLGSSGFATRSERMVLDVSS